MKDIMGYLVQRLRRAQPRRWPAIAEATGVSFGAITKIAYEYADPRLSTAQPLVDFFIDVSAGRRKLPPLPPDGRVKKRTASRTPPSRTKRLEAHSTGS